MPAHERAAQVYIRCERFHAQACISCLYVFEPLCLNGLQVTNCGRIYMTRRGSSRILFPGGRHLHAGTGPSPSLRLACHRGHHEACRHEATSSRHGHAVCARTGSKHVLSSVVSKTTLEVLKLHLKMLKKKTCSGRMAGKEKENMKRKGKQRLVVARWQSDEKTCNHPRGYYGFSC